MPRLFSYRIAVDHGSAPNPFGGICTLAICKPKIRRAARTGDWVIGTGSAASPIGDISGKIIYAMEITDKMTMAEYDKFTKRCLQSKIPKWSSGNSELMAGDSIYDFKNDPPMLRRSVHNEKHRERDLGGRYVLLSRNFHYFGDKAISIPRHLRPIICKGRGHQSARNQVYLEPLLHWLSSFKLAPNRLHGRPISPLADDNKHRRRRKCLC